MTDSQTTKAPLIELARRVPKDLHAQWEIQWFEDGTPCGHSMAPVGKYIHDLADALDAKDAEIARLNDEIVNLEVVAKDRYCKMQTEIERLRSNFIWLQLQNGASREEAEEVADSLPPIDEAELSQYDKEQNDG